MKKSMMVAIAAIMASSAFDRPEATIRAKPINDYEPPQFKRPDNRQWRRKKRGKK